MQIKIMGVMKMEKVKVMEPIPKGEEKKEEYKEKV